MRPFWKRGEPAGGRHARQAPAAPPPAPAPARPPLPLGAGAYLRPRAAPDSGPAFTGLRAAGGTQAAVIHLGSGFDLDVTRTLWLDDLAAAARDARDALTRDAREVRQAQIRAATAPRFTPAEDPPEGRGA
jgi:hypothetical protein